METVPLYYVEEKFRIVSPSRGKDVVGMENFWFGTNLINHEIVKCLKKIV